MKKERRTERLALLFWALTAVCFVTIFYFSSRTSGESSSQSNYIIYLLKKVFSMQSTPAYVRQAAHFLEFTGTSLIMSAAFYFTLQKNKLYLPVGCTSLYAVTDEIHQIFVDGRSCQLRDWVTDTLGAILGAALFYLIYYLFKKANLRKARRKNK